MADNEYEENSDIEIKVEPILQCYIEEQHNDDFRNFANANAIPSSVDVTLSSWSSKATTCLINQYKKYRSLVDSMQIRSLREMFEMISMEMQKQGFYFNPQKCENKWRVLIRKYRNLYCKRSKKSGRIRHGEWEHKRDLDEIFNEKKKNVYLEENDSQPSSESTQYSMPYLLKHGHDQSSNLSVNQQHKDLSSRNTMNEKKHETLDCKQTLTILFEKFAEEMEKNFVMIEKNKERRHKEKMIVKHAKLELKKQLIKLKEQKMHLQSCKIFAAAENLRSSMK